MVLEIEKVLLSEEQILTRVRELGQKISADYEGKDLLVVGILKGAFIFMSDLVRQISIPVEVDFMATSSYGQSTKTSGVVKVLKDLDSPIEGRHILIVGGCNYVFKYLELILATLAVPARYHRYSVQELLLRSRYRFGA